MYAPATIGGLVVANKLSTINWRSAGARQSDKTNNLGYMNRTLLLAVLFTALSLGGYAQEKRIIGMRPFSAESPADSSVRHTVAFYHFQYLSDGLTIKGYLGVPKGVGKYPCIIYNRGGNERLGTINEAEFIRFQGPICSKGYIVEASQYRGADSAEGKDEFGGKDVNDVLNLLPVLDEIPNADTSKIGMFGWSRGGMMTYIALTKTNRIKAAVVGSGLTDLIKLLEHRPVFAKMYAGVIPGYKKDKIAPLKERSAVYFAKDVCKTTPILILHGTADQSVPADQSLDIARRFYEVKQPFRYILYEGGAHSLTAFSTHYYKEMIDWFDRYLKEGAPLPNLDGNGE